MEIKGKYNSALVFAEIVDDSAIAQIINLCNQEFVAGSTIRVMPDVHAGAGCTIGTTMTVQDKVVPNLVGVDIGCGMEVVRLKQKRLELQQLDRLIHERIPAGFAVREREHSLAAQIDISELRCAKKVNLRRARLSIGSLGGGNHFIEVNQDEEGRIYIVIHSGSRRLGLEVAEYYQQAGYERLNGLDEAAVRRFIASYKEAGREREIKKALRDYRACPQSSVPKALAYVEGELMEDYLHDMALAQHYASLNRRAMMDELLRGLKLDVEEQFTTIHNYIDLERMILRKGAVSAQAGELLLIPLNMRDGSLLCRGKGNPDWNYSAPHGAGRLMSRSAAKNALTLHQFREEMEGIYSTTVSRATLDEAPMAYKPMEAITEQIGDTVEILGRLRPLYNFKAAE